MNSLRNFLFRCGEMSRTLRTMEDDGLVRLNESGIMPKVAHGRIELELPLTVARKAG